MKTRRKNKRGSLYDVLVIGITLLVLAMLILLGFTIMSKINNKFQATSSIDTYGHNVSQDLTDKYTGIIDNMFLFLAIGIGIVSLCLAAMVRISPIFLVFYIIILIIFLILCGVFSNIYQGMADNPELSVYADQLIFTSLVLDYLPFIVGIFGFIIMIIMYKVGQD